MYYIHIADILHVHYPCKMSSVRENVSQQSQDEYPRNLGIFEQYLKMHMYLWPPVLRRRPTVPLSAWLSQDSQDFSGTIPM